MAKRRRRGLRVRRQVRRLELWPVAKLALAFHLACGAVTLGALVVVWLIGRKLGTIDRAAKFLEDVGFAKDFEINGSVLFRGAALVSGALVVLNTVGTLVLAFLYNSLSGVLGGLIFSVLEEQPRTAGGGRNRRRRRGRSGALDESQPPPAPTRRSQPSDDAPVPAPSSRAAANPPPAPRAAATQESEDWLAAARDAS